MKRFIFTLIAGFVIGFIAVSLINPNSWFYNIGQPQAPVRTQRINQGSPGGRIIIVTLGENGQYTLTRTNDQ